MIPLCLVLAWLILGWITLVLWCREDKDLLGDDWAVLRGGALVLWPIALPLLILYVLLASSNSLLTKAVEFDLSKFVQDIKTPREKKQGEPIPHYGKVGKK